MMLVTPAVAKLVPHGDDTDVYPVGDARDLGHVARNLFFYDILVPTCACM